MFLCLLSSDACSSHGHNSSERWKDFVCSVRHGDGDGDGDEQNSSRSAELKIRY